MALPVRRALAPRGGVIGAHRSARTTAFESARPIPSPAAGVAIFCLACIGVGLNVRQALKGQADFVPLRGVTFWEVPIMCWLLASGCAMSCVADARLD